jgi:hypothetical protein
MILRKSFLRLSILFGILAVPFHALADGGSSFGSAVGLSEWTDQTSYIAANETEYFTMSMTAGYSYLIYSYSQTGDVDMHYYISNSSQTQLAASGWHNIGNPVLNNGVVFNCPTTGTYYLTINSHNNTQTGSLTFRTRYQTSNTASINLGTTTFSETLFGNNMTISGSIYNGWEVDFGAFQSYEFIGIYINGTRATISSGGNFSILKNSTTNFSFTVPITAINGAVSGNNSIVIKAMMMNPYGSFVNDEDTYSVNIAGAPVNPTGITGATSSCSGSSVELTATGPVGTVYWYTLSCGGTATTPATGNTLTVRPTVTTTYYARNYNNATFSPGCASITITVSPVSAGGTAKW